MKKSIKALTYEVNRQISKILIQTSASQFLKPICYTVLFFSGDVQVGQFSLTVFPNYLL